MGGFKVRGGVGIGGGRGGGLPDLIQGVFVLAQEIVVFLGEELELFGREARFDDAFFVRAKVAGFGVAVAVAVGSGPGFAFPGGGRRRGGRPVGWFRAPASSSSDSSSAAHVQRAAAPLHFSFPPSLHHPPVDLARGFQAPPEIPQHALPPRFVGAELPRLLFGLRFGAAVRPAP